MSKKKKRNKGKVKEEWLDDETDIKSKTQIKAEMNELQDIGVQISELPKAVYKSFAVPESLDEAIQTLHRIKNWNAQKRQHQYIGRVMREIGEEEVERLQRLLNDYQLGRKKLNREFQKLENTREALIDGDQETLQNLLEDYPSIERQQLMQVIRAAQKEAKQNEGLDATKKQDKHFKKLFQFLKAEIKASQSS